MTIYEVDGVKVVSLEIDHLDALNSEEIKKNMIEMVQGAEKIVLDLNKITFVDSSGLGVILTVFRSIKESSGNMVICSVHESVKVLFKLVRLSHMIQIFDNPKEAILEV